MFLVCKMMDQVNCPLRLGYQIRGGACCDTGATRDQPQNQQIVKGSRAENHRHIEFEVSMGYPGGDSLETDR